MKKPSLLLCALLIAPALQLVAGDAPPPQGVRWTNSLGMIFVPIPKHNVSFCIWETRIKDYEVFVREGHWARLWPKKPEFPQEQTHPVVNVSWEDAREFCIWLSKREHDLGLLQPTQAYRLPTDREWSAAVGLLKEAGRTAEQRAAGISDLYPWGKASRPSEGHRGARVQPPMRAGNYTSGTDGYKFTAPVGAFDPNPLGIFDLGGNVWEWCFDFADDGRRHVLRGGSWFSGAVSSATRDFTLPDGEIGDFGFRCVRADSPSLLD
jgi:formylglycine-generating enzyme required for sulfatase activity